MNRLVKKAILFSVILALALGISLAIIHYSSRIEAFDRYGYIGALVAPFLSSAVSIPIPFVSSVAGLAVTTAVFNCAGIKWLVPLLAGLGGTLGELVGYGVGRGGRRAVSGSSYFSLSHRWSVRIMGIIVFCSALFPLGVFDFVAIAAGALKFSPLRFFLCCLVGRIPRSFIETYIGGGIVDIIF
jgi:membrane protein YqaA with SNARE-associated domain